MNRLHLYRNLLPNLEGNIGTTSVDERTQSNPTITDINPDVNSPFVKESVLNKWAEELNNRNIADALELLLVATRCAPTYARQPTTTQ